VFFSCFGRGCDTVALPQETVWAPAGLGTTINNVKHVR
jgi:hypothetical protein